ncbi:MAG: winged helix-turn-helix domain-containing protein [Ruminococcus sp.]|nr:winged helix-turn-helix domain-containing protein [Ruminococcus sp.]
MQEQYEITMPIRTVGEYLRRWKFTVQKPAK